MAPKISDVNFTPTIPNRGLIGFASFVLEDNFLISGLGIHTLLNGSGIRLVYPEKILPNGLKIPLVRPLNRTVGEITNVAVWETIQDLQRKIKQGG